jgi:hypothetical protein
VVTPSTPIGRARATKRTRRIVAISLGLWALFLAGYITLLMIGHTLGDLGCEYPAGSSNYGTASLSTTLESEAETTAENGATVGVVQSAWFCVLMLGRLSMLRPRSR